MVFMFVASTASAGGKNESKEESYHSTKNDPICIPIVSSIIAARLPDATAPNTEKNHFEYPCDERYEERKERKDSHHNCTKAFVGKTEQTKEGG